MVMDSQQQAMWQHQLPELSNDRIDFTKHTVNTFIHFADQAEPPRPFGLDRSQTAPPKLQEFDGHDVFEDLSAAVSPAPSALGRQLPSQDLGDQLPAHQRFHTALDHSPAHYGSTALDHLPAHQRFHTAPGAPQPQTLVCISADGHNPQNNKYKVIWTVDSRKLNSNDKQAVSPPFELRFSDVHPLVTFKMIIYPREREGDGKGGASFKRSQGLGLIQLKCEGDLSNAHASVAFQIAIGNAHTGVCAKQGVRPPNPFTHNFAQSAICGLPRASDDTWDFNDVVDHGSKTFTVHLDIKTEIIQT